MATQGKSKGELAIFSPRCSISTVLNPGAVLPEESSSSFGKMLCWRTELVRLPWVVGNWQLLLSRSCVKWQSVQNFQGLSRLPRKDSLQFEPLAIPTLGRSMHLPRTPLRGNECSQTWIQRQLSTLVGDQSLPTSWRI